jgi:hypothetical protein
MDREEILEVTEVPDGVVFPFGIPSFENLDLYPNLTK